MLVKLGVDGELGTFDVDGGPVVLYDLVRVELSPAGDGPGLLWPKVGVELVVLSDEIVLTLLSLVSA